MRPKSPGPPAPLTHDVTQAVRHVQRSLLAVDSAGRLVATADELGRVADLPALRRSLASRRADLVLAREELDDVLRIT